MKQVTDSCIATTLKLIPAMIQRTVAVATISVQKVTDAARNLTHSAVSKALALPIAMVFRAIHPMIRRIADSVGRSVAWVKSAPVVFVPLELVEPIVMEYGYTHPMIRRIAGSVEDLVRVVILVLVAFVRLKR